MKNDDFKNILGDLAENAKPAAQVDLWPGLKKSLVTSDGQPNKGKTIMNPNPVLSRAALAALALMLVFAILLASPQGQAFAQELLKYFTTVSEKTIPPMPTQVPAPTYTLEAGLTPQSPMPVPHQDCGDVISPIASTFICQLQDAQTRLGFAVKSFSARSVQASFDFMWLDLEYRTLEMRFRNEQAAYSLVQGLGEFPKDCWGCAIYQDAVELVQVGDRQAEYAAGAYVMTVGESESMAWNPEEPTYHLRWKENGHWYSLRLSTYQSDPSAEPKSGEIQEKVIQLAEDLVNLDDGAGQLTAGNQPSIKDSVGFSIKELGMLPKGFQQVPDGSWSSLITAPRVGMRYEYRVDGQWVNSLTLNQMLIPTDDQTLLWEFGLIYQNQALGYSVEENMGEKVQINGITGYYLDGGESLASALYWRDNEREYLLIYQWTPEFGGRLDKETLIAIAESLK